jgi:hypothetical protein
MVVCGALSLWPFRFARRWKSWNLYLPVAGLAFYGLYEVALPLELVTGARMALVVPLLLFLWVNGMAKVVLLATLQERSGGSRRRLRAQPQRRLQLVLGLAVGLACALWAWRAIS